MNCRDLPRFTGGTLDKYQAMAFRIHLSQCQICQLHLSAAAMAIAVKQEQTKPLRPAYVVDPEPFGDEVTIHGYEPPLHLPAPNTRQMAAVKPSYVDLHPPQIDEPLSIVIEWT